MTLDRGCIPAEPETCPSSIPASGLRMAPPARDSQENSGPEMELTCFINKITKLFKLDCRLCCSRASGMISHEFRGEAMDCGE